MTKITLSTGDSYYVNKPSSDIMPTIAQHSWVFIEDDGRDIAIRTDHIVAIEDDHSSIIAEAYKHMEKEAEEDEKK